MDNQIIPNELVIAGLIIGVMLLATELIFKISAFGNIHWWDHLLGIIPGTVFLLLVAMLGMLLYKTEDVMGMGDVKIFAPIGLILGWKLCIVALFISIFLGGLTSMFLILTKTKNRRDLIPFGPFIVAGTFITFLFGSIILEWYLRFL
jgi:leader peptidase (prepilin peptidase)/N-methyltransferase